MIGATLQNRYRLDAELGRGGMGVVYRAHDTLLDRAVAVKVLSESRLGTEGRARLLREARAAAQLNHPNIVAIHDAGEVDGTPFIVMELAEGETLHARRPPGIDEIVEIARQLCAALEHAHAHGIIHRDLKPENVICTPLSRSQEPGVRVKLMDFGLARSLASRLSAEGTLVGTVFYLAPEQIRGDAIDGRADLYALGVVLYELTAERLPFVADDPIAVISQHLHAPVAPPSTFNADIPPALDALIVRLLSKAPDERPASAAEVRQALEELDRQPAGYPTTQLSLIDRIVRGRLVARESELAKANAVWRTASAGDSGVLLISGEPGIGKTRLVRELMAQAQVQRAHVLLGECYAEGGGPYAPIAQIIQPTVDLTGLQDLSGLVLADLITLAPSLRSRFPDAPPNPPLEPQAEQQRLFDSVVELCATLGARAPVLLILDDAHWADGGTLALLRHLARRAPKLKLRLLIVLTYREVELDEARALNDVLHDLNRERLATRLKLTRLDRDQTRDLLASMFAEEITPEFLDGIYRETEGNPFFVEEVCKALVEEGKLVRKGNRWDRPSMSEIEVPQSVKIAIQARVNKLPTPAQDALKLASVLGREFDFETLKAVSDLSEDDLLDALEHAERAQLIDEVRHPAKLPAARTVFAFAHALIPSTLHDGLSGIRRQRLHQRAGLTLERLYPDRLASRELAPQLGRHFSEASEWDKAVNYLLQAGERAREVYAYQEAIGYFRQALAILRDQGPAALDRAARTAMKLAQLHHTLFDFAQSRQAYQEAFALWQRAGEARSAVTLLPAPHALRMYWPIDAEVLDSTQATYAPAVQVIEQLFSGLVELTADLDIVPAVARMWEVLDDGRTYVFHLRDDAKWSDGRPVTAGDFEFAWKRVLNPAAASSNAEFLFDVKGARAFHQGRAAAEAVGVRAIDDRTLIAELEEPVGHFLHLAACAATFPIPRHVVATHGDEWSAPEHIVTGGPFRLESWRRGESMVLSRDPDYRGPWSGNLSRVELTFVTRWTSQLLLEKYEADLHDYGHLDGPDMVEQARRDRPGEFVSAPAAHTLYVGFDTTRPPFGDVRVRQAFVHAVDRQALADVVHRGSVSPATGGFVPQGLPGHSPGIGLAYDPDRARRLLAEAGYPGGRGFPAIDAWHSYRGERQLHDAFLSAQWRDNLGISINWEPMDWPEYSRRLATNPPHLYRMAWLADYPDPGDYLRVALHQPYSRWRNEQFEKLLETARRIPDLAERVKFYQAADRLLIEDAAILPLAHQRFDMLVKPWVRRFPVSPLKTAYFKDVVIDPH